MKNGTKRELREKRAIFYIQSHNRMFCLSVRSISGCSEYFHHQTHYLVRCAGKKRATTGKRKTHSARESHSLSNLDGGLLSQFCSFIRHSAMVIRLNPDKSGSTFLFLYCCAVSSSQLRLSTAIRFSCMVKFKWTSFICLRRNKDFSFS